MGVVSGRGLLRERLQAGIVVRQALWQVGQLLVDAAGGQQFGAVFDVSVGQTAVGGRMGLFVQLVGQRREYSWDVAGGSGSTAPA